MRHLGLAFACAGAFGLIWELYWLPGMPVGIKICFVSLFGIISLAMIELWKELR